MKKKGTIILFILLLLGVWGYFVVFHKAFPFRQLYMTKEFLDYRYGWFDSDFVNPDVGEAEVMETFLNRLLVKKVFIHNEMRFGGGISNVDDKLFIAASKGMLFVFDLETNSKLEADISRIPLNYDDLILSGHTTRNSFRQVWYRVSGLYAERTGSSTFMVYASHNGYDRDTDCITHNVSRSEIEIRNGRAEQPGGWQTIFTAEPCIKPVPEHYLEAPYNGNISGGRMAHYDEKRLLVSVGDYDNNGLNQAPVYASDPDVPYGKFILLDRETGEWSVYTKGHRNPMGLFIDREGTIWSSENGPRAGDELNIIVEGENYGWPEVSYGVWYDMNYPLDEGRNIGVHANYKKPVFSWVPAIAPTSLVRIEGEKFPEWSGDLIMGTMTNQSLRRLRLNSDLNVVYDEQIRIGHRVRDLTVLYNDMIALITDDGYLMVLDDGGSVHVEMDGEAQQRLVELNRFEGLGGELSVVESEPEAPVTAGVIYSRHCEACHSTEPSHGVGPHLYEMFHREVGGPDNYPYSNVLRNDNREWTPELMRNFLTDPDRYFPNNRMAKINLTPAEIDSIIYYLTDI